MLRPFKSFLNNLQKNAETFFGAKNNSPDMNPEEEEEIATDSMYNIDELDPLADPLALDDEIGERTLEHTSSNLTHGDINGSHNAQIILVDVNSLKNSFTIPLSYDNTVEITTTPSTSAAGAADVSFDPIELTIEDGITEEIEGSRSDGSDSGLGLELCAGLLSDKITTSPNVRPTRSNLKRRSDPCDQIDAIEMKKPKRNIQFTDVTVFYFPRIQGFTCVPSQGGCTLGMTSKHIDEKSFTLNEHISEQKRIHRQQMLDRARPPPSLASLLPSPVLLNSNQMNAPSVASTSASTSADDRSRSSTEESDSEEDILSDNSSSELDTETIGFLQPVSQKQRRALLKAAGVREIASSEKNECRDIRASREFCGCSCRDYCDPETCLCSQAGIKCQVDRASFPCGCTQDGCGNVVGRLEFNPKRVRTHFIHTIMRLELEKKQKKSDKQNTLHTYDGRLRLRECDDDTTVVDSAGMNNRLHSYNATNNIYPVASSTGVAGNSMDNATTTVNSHETENTSRNSSMAESPLDLHYAFRNDYTIDGAQNNYSLVFPSPSYYSNSAAPTYVDFNALTVSNQSSIIPSYSNYPNYSTPNSYNGLIGSGQPSTATDKLSSCSNYGAPDTGGVHSGSIYDNIATESYLSSASNSKETKVSDQFNGKYTEYLHDPIKLLDVSSDLNCLLNDDNLSPHPIDPALLPNSTNGNCAIDALPDAATSSEPLSYMRFESEFANKLNAANKYSLTDESSGVVDKSELFQKDSVLTT